MRVLLALTALIVAAPAVVHAQDAAERRREQAYENLRQLDQNQRIGEVERQITNMELRRQAEENLRQLQTPRTTTQAPYTVPGSSAATGVSPIRPLVLPGASVLEATADVRPGVSTEDNLRDLELAASNARLKEIAAAQRGQ